MIKNIGKFKQWTGEKIGKAQKTRMDEDFNGLQTETEAQRVALDKLHESSHAYLKAMSKRVEGDDKFKGLAIETFGICMSAQSYTLPEGSSYRDALLQMGDAHQSIGTAQSELISRLGSSYIECLERAQAQMKEYQAMQKKLHSRRLDYDAKLAKVQKAKKEKPEWEEEMQAAKAKYEDTRECVLGIMSAISESQDDNVISLKAYYDAQLAYARRMVEILEAVPESTFAVSPSASQPRHERRICRQSSFDPEEERSYHSDDRSSIHSIPTPTATTGRYNQLDRTPSFSNVRRQNTINSNHHSGNGADLSPVSHLAPNGTPVRKNSTGMNRTNGYSASALAPPPPVPTPAAPVREKACKQVRALYNFDATAEGELSLRKGDIVRIIEEIDEGWWEGELVDASGGRYEGMFPSNYVEEIEQSPATERPQLPQRQGSVYSNYSDSKRYNDVDEQAYYARATAAAESSPQYEEPEPSYAESEPEPVQVPAARRAPPPPMVRQLSFTAPLARATPPPSRPASGMATTSKTVGSRMAPPPPPTRRAGGATESTRPHSGLNVVTTPPTGSAPTMMGYGKSNSNNNRVSPMPATPNGHGHGHGQGGYLPKECIGQQQQASVSTVAPCRECQCDDFTANVFKPGSCNNCFHTH
ncbi:hypothetical protein BG015_004240 [Linnemannia schmuckeri]|uniref:BAR-domain-containing protein n=1 Tax=Linnemannia schmuckeri TaxID=64567 RepID=A0A9P5S5G8_9FUNG|nr:hypothetical protein BG015_004240 [Linnemannia schmuckeri]